MHSWLHKRRVRKNRVRLQHAPQKILFWVGGIGALFIVCGGVGAWFSHIELLRITTVSVRGTDVLSKEILEENVREALVGNYIGLFARTNTLLYPKNEIKASLYEAFPRIKDMDVAREGKNALLISILEYEPYGLWCGVSPLGDEETCYFIDRNGYIFAQSPEYSGSIFFKYYGALPLKTSPVRQSFLAPEIFTSIETFVRGLSEFGFEASAVFVDENDDYIFLLHDGSEVRLSYVTNVLSMLRNISALLDSKEYIRDKGEQNLLYIDMRFPQKILYKFDGE